MAREPFQVLGLLEEDDCVIMQPVCLCGSMAEQRPRNAQVWVRFPAEALVREWGRSPASLISWWFPGSIPGPASKAAHRLKE